MGSNTKKPLWKRAVNYSQLRCTYLLPENYSYKNDVGSLRISWKRKGREIEFHSPLILDGAFIPVRLYDPLRDLFNLTVKALKNQVLILKKGPHLTAEAMPLTSK